MKIRNCLTFCLCLLLFYAIINADTLKREYWVDADAPDNSGDGSFEKPWKNITDALENVFAIENNRATIHIKPGIYNAGNAEVFPVKLPNYVSLKGENPHNTIIDASGTNKAVLYLQNDNCSIENLTITGGNGFSHYEADSYIVGTIYYYYYSYKYFAGGIYCCNSSLSIKNCVIKDNITLNRKQSYNQIHNPEIKFFTSEPSPETDNETNDYYGSTYTHYDYISYGGGIYGVGSDIKITNSIIADNSIGFSSNNKCNDTLEEWYFSNGGGIYSEESDLTITNSIIINNDAAVEHELGEYDMVISEGGGIASFESELTISNSAIINNNSNDFRAIYSDKEYIIDHSIFWYYPETYNQLNTADKFSNNRFAVTGKDYIYADPRFTTGPWGDYYLSQKAAGQRENSPCIDAGSDLSANLGLAQKTTRSDGVVDTGIVDIGYHYPPPIQFSMYLSPAKECYQNGDYLTIIADITTCPEPTDADIYFLMMNPEGIIYSGFMWNEGIVPMINDITLPENLDYAGLPLLSVTIPCDKPPVSSGGRYIFAIGASKPGSMDIISNVGK